MTSNHSLFPHLYLSINDFGRKGGHVRRGILLQVKGIQMEIQQKVDTAQQELASISYNTNPQAWSTAMEKFQVLHEDLVLIKEELRKLEDIHVNVNHGVLPY